MAARVTVVNDSTEFLELVHDILEDDRYDATAIDGHRPDAIELIRASRPELLMIDLHLGAEGGPGWQIAQLVRREPEFESLPVLLCSADPLGLRELESEISATQRVSTLTKPFTVDELTDAIDRLLADSAVH